MRITALALAMLVPLTAWAAWPEPTIKVPFVEGLVLARSVSEPRGDYETLRTVDSISPDGYTITNSGEVPGDDGQVGEYTIRRRISAADQREARKMRLYFHTSDPSSFPGTVPGVSSAFVRDIREKGSAPITFLDVGSLFGMTMTRRTMSGNLSRVGSAPVNIPTLVNGRMTNLPAIHAKGFVAEGSEREEMELFILDDPQNPIMLRGRGPGFASIEVTRIEYPEPKASKTAKGSMEQALADRKTVEVHSIYFAFASARIRPQSERVLGEIAEILKSHPDWSLRIDGFTDNVGGDTSNLELSSARAAAVKSALVQRYAVADKRLTTGGYGEGSPKDTNLTAKGRARNRRVELSRM